MLAAAVRSRSCFLNSEICFASARTLRFRSGVYEFPLTGAQKSFLRGRGQKLDPTLKLGKGGSTPAFFAELQRALRAQELVKLRFLGVERDEREALCAKIADEGRCVFVGAVGHTALFYRQHPELAERRITLP
jgi:RNA-binding protein